jgi:hypothetical protein
VLDNGNSYIIINNSKYNKYIRYDIGKLFCISKAKVMGYKTNLGSIIIYLKKHLVYIPKNGLEKYYYSNEKTIDDLTYTATPTVRSKGEFSSQASLVKFQSILGFNRHCISGHIPCVYLKGSFQQHKLIIYFHSNAEDIVSAFNLIESISTNLGRSMIMMEYPGYSIYQSNTGM